MAAFRKLIALQLMTDWILECNNILYNISQKHQPSKHLGSLQGSTDLIGRVKAQFFLYFPK